MKRIVTAILLSVFISTVPMDVTAGDRWQEGGNLHGAFVGQWKMAPYSNKLATAADWIATRPRIKDKAIYNRMLNNLRPFAFELVQCVNESTAAESLDSNRSASELAATCMILKGW